MIGPAEVLEGLYFVARRCDVVARYEHRSVLAALREAEALAGTHLQEEPAALFFAFSKYERAFAPALWGLMVATLARGRANALGFALHAHGRELAELRLDINEGAVDPPTVRVWFVERLVWLCP